jgi:trigger factor
MAVTLETLSPLERRLDIALPSSEIETEVADRLKRLARTVKMHGFRPGRVPVKVVALQYAEQVRREVLGDALQKSFGAAVVEQKLKVAGFPRFEPKASEQTPPQVEFSATFEIYPEIVVGEISNVTITRPVISLTDAEVDKTLNIMRKQRASYEAVTRAAVIGDKVTVDFIGKIDGQEFEGGKGEALSVVLGDGKLLKDFENHVVGMETGDSRTF